MNLESQVLNLKLAKEMDDKERLNKVASSNPINKTAALVVSKGTSYKTPSFVGGRRRVTSEHALPLRTVPYNVEDLTGAKRGSLTVIGLSIFKKKMGGANRGKGKKRKYGQTMNLWCVRCVCGNYELRRAKAIKKDEQDECSECHHTDRMRNNKVD